jgi:DNA polymerase III epsilon subunit-like protein
MNSKSKFNTLVIIDLETTGLIYDEPKITELAMVAVNM